MPDQKSNPDEKFQRKIIHIDMDAYYASVEIKDNPEWKDLPVIVGGSPKSRGVVCAASYKAREFGVRSAMACATAYRLCPNALFVSPRFERYRDISREIRSIFARYSDRIEPLSLDEAWLDVTENPREIPSATWIAQAIKKDIRGEFDLTCSAGVSFNKMLAKIASDEDKPDGLFVIDPERAEGFLLNMEVKKIPGVGKVTQKKLGDMGVTLGSHLVKIPKDVLIERFGKTGGYLFNMIRGNDFRPVTTHRKAKSVSVESTFAEDRELGEFLKDEFGKLISRLEERLRKVNALGRTVTLKVKFFDFQIITRSYSREGGYSEIGDVKFDLDELLKNACLRDFPKKKIRLLGVGVSNFFQPTEDLQISFFDYLEESGHG